MEAAALIGNSTRHGSFRGQVIVNTHAPAVVGLVDDADLLVAVPAEIVLHQRRCGTVRFAWLEETRPHQGSPDVLTVSRGHLRAYLNPFGADRRESCLLRHVRWLVEQDASDKLVAADGTNSRTVWNGSAMNSRWCLSRNWETLKAILGQDLDVASPFLPAVRRAGLNVTIGYEFHLVLLWLPSADFAVQRVADRVRMGGHHVPEAAVRRRYERGPRNFFQLYQPLATTWAMYDNSETGAMRLIAAGQGTQTSEAAHPQTWQQLQQEYGHGQ